MSDDSWTWDGDVCVGVIYRDRSQSRFLSQDACDLAFILAQNFTAFACMQRPIKVWLLLVPAAVFLPTRESTLTFRYGIAVHVAGGIILQGAVTLHIVASRACAVWNRGNSESNQSTLDSCRSDGAV